MLELPPPLAAMAGWRQFIVCKLVPSATRPGKSEKLPTDYRTGKTASAHDSAIWLSFDDAAGYAAAFGPDYMVGFVITELDDIWFCDIDNCLDETRISGWSETADALMSRLNGAAWEISASGKGLHGLGRGRCPPHKTRYHQYFEFYTANRFVALTGQGAVGEFNTDHTAAITQLVADYLTRTDEDKASGWTTEPDPRWRGNTDDDELIARMLNSKGSMSATLGYKATFQQLWDADADALAKFWPENNPQKNRPFAPTEADAALAQALAFWTGNNCERIERLMRRSALVREKWDRHSTYLELTITRAVGRQHDVLQDKPPEAVQLPAAADEAPGMTAVTGSTFMTAHMQVDLFKGCVYLKSQNRALVPGGDVVKPDSFRVTFGGRSFVMDESNERVIRDAWEAFTQNTVFRPPMADDLAFRPKLPPATIITEGDRKYVNTWWPIKTPCTPGDAGLFTRHLAKLFPDDRDRQIITSYLAALVQYPGWKFQWAPLIQGIEGNGKTFIVTAITMALGDNYSHMPNVNDIGETGAKFTGWIRGKLFLGFEEIRTTDRRNMVEVLKQIVTNKRIEIQNKGQDQVTGDNCANIIACSNHKDAIPKNNKDRRWAIFYTAQQDDGDLQRDGMDGEYMPALWDWANDGGFAVINHFLKSYAIADEFNPATHCHRAPITTSTVEAIELSAGNIEQEIIESVEGGAVGFCNGWISSHYLDALLKKMRMEKAVPPNKRRELLKTLGYIWHPALVDAGGRSPIVVKPDGVRSRLFVKKGNLLANFTDPRQVAKRYESDQAQGAIDNASFGT